MYFMKGILSERAPLGIGSFYQELQLGLGPASQGFCVFWLARLAPAGWRWPAGWSFLATHSPPSPGQGTLRVQ